jgi:phage shock protein E
MPHLHQLPSTPDVALALAARGTILGRMISKIILVILAIIVVFVLYQRFTAVRISGSDARSFVAEGAMLVDVRSPGEFSGGHIEGAISIPIQELSGRTDELGDKSSPIVLYCQSGARSAMAKRLLESKGFSEVHDMGSMGSW